MKSKEIRKKIEALQKDLEKAELRELKEEEFSPYTKDERNLATIIHKNECRWNHIGGCDWYYDKGDWSQYSRKKYATRAEKILKSFSYKETIDFLKIFYNKENIEDETTE